MLRSGERRCVYERVEFGESISRTCSPWTVWTFVDLGARDTVTSPWNGKPLVLRASVETMADKADWAWAYSGVITLRAPRSDLVPTTFAF